MKPVYTSLAMKTGTLNPGLWKVEFALKEWLVADPLIDFQTGAVKTPLQLVSGRALLAFTFVEQSYDLDIKPKTVKGGDYDEVNLTGILNELDPVTLQTLETYRYHQLVVVATDRKKIMRVIGNKEVGMKLAHSQKVTNGTTGGETLQLNFYAEGEQIAPYYLL